MSGPRFPCKGTDSRIIVLDEAQSIPDIGLTLKVLVDTRPELQIIATGSSSFDMAQAFSEPLTGRSRTFTLYPFSLTEISQDSHPVDWNARLQKSKNRRNFWKAIKNPASKLYIAITIGIFYYDTSVDPKTLGRLPKSLGLCQRSFPFNPIPLFSEA